MTREIARHLNLDVRPKSLALQAPPQARLTYMTSPAHGAVETRTAHPDRAKAAAPIAAMTKPQYDAGVRNLDHCAPECPFAALDFPLTQPTARCEQAPRMAISPALLPDSHSALGNAVPGLRPGCPANACSGFVLCLYRKFGYPHLLHDHAAHPILVRLHQSWKSVGSKHNRLTFLSLPRERFILVCSS